MRLLMACGVIAAGEFAASCVPTWAATWPLLAVLMVLAGLLGYGFAIRGWPVLCLFLLGAALFFGAASGREQLYRESPWLRNGPQRVRREKTVGGRLAADLRYELGRRVAIGLSHDRETASLNRAILLGERGGLSGRLRRIFVESGTMHVFAISGLHVMTVAKMLAFLLAALTLPRRWAGAVAIPLVWGYVFVIGCAPSAVRAATMTSFYYAAPVFWRRPDGLRAWGLTFLAVYVENPLMIENVGCALSFVVMLAIVMTSGWVNQFGRIKASLLMTTVVWAVGVPISAHVFGRVTPGGMLANLVVVAAAVWTVRVGAVGLAASFVSDGLAVLLNNFSALLTNGMVFVASLVASLPGGNLDVRRWSLTECGGWYLAVALAGVLAHRRRKMI